MTVTRTDRISLLTTTFPLFLPEKTEKIPYDKALYKLRKRIEIFFGKLKENRRLAMRYEKLGITFLAFITWAAIKINFNL